MYTGVFVICYNLSQTILIALNVCQITTFIVLFPAMKYTSESCDQIDCGKDKKCVMKSDKPKCVCAPNCTRSELDKRGELCGSDGRRYKNKCAMLKERCRTGNDELKVAYYGRCEG